MPLLPARQDRGQDPPPPDLRCHGADPGRPAVVRDGRRRRDFRERQRRADAGTQPGEIVSALKAAPASQLRADQCQPARRPCGPAGSARADHVAAKLDAACDDRLRRVDRPVGEIGLAELRGGLLSFRREYRGKLRCRRCCLAAGRSGSRRTTPPSSTRCSRTRSSSARRPGRALLVHELDARGGRPDVSPAYAVRRLKSVQPQVLEDFAARLRRATGVPVRGPRPGKPPRASAEADEPKRADDKWDEAHGPVRAYGARARRERRRRRLRQQGGPEPANIDEIASVLRQDSYDLELLISFGTSKAAPAGHLALAIRDQAPGDDLVYSAELLRRPAPEHAKATTPTT